MVGSRPHLGFESSQRQAMFSVKSSSVSVPTSEFLAAMKVLGYVSFGVLGDSEGSRLGHLLFSVDVFGQTSWVHSFGFAVSVSISVF